MSKQNQRFGRPFWRSTALAGRKDPHDHLECARTSWWELRGFEPMAIAGAVRTRAGSPVGGFARALKAALSGGLAFRLAASRYRERGKDLVAQSPTERAWLQAADIARRLSRGDQLHEDA